MVFIGAVHTSRSLNAKGVPGTQAHILKNKNYANIVLNQTNLTESTHKQNNGIFDSHSRHAMSLSAIVQVSWYFSSNEKKP